MKSYILKRIDDVQRRKLSESGVIFYDWGQDIVVVQNQLALILELLDMQAEEAGTDFQNMDEITLKPRAVKVAQMRESTRESVSAKSNTATDKARAAYIKASKQRLKAQLDTAQSSLDELERRMPKLGGNYADLSRKEFLAVSAGDREERRVLSVQEYQRLRALPAVTGVRVIQGSILVYTEDLVAADRNGNTKDVGSFLIVIDTAGGASPIRWYNQTRQVDAWKPRMQAPYVLQDGSPLATEMQETFIQLIAQLEFCVVAELAIQFIQTVNDDEAGNYLNCWPAISTGVSKRSKK